MRISSSRIVSISTIASLCWIQAAHFASGLCTSSTFLFRRSAARSDLIRRCLSSEASDELILRWESMYQQGETKNKETGQETLKLDHVKSEVRVVTFDLDNTLWNTGATISAANDALAAFLDEHDIVQPTRVEHIMGQLFQASKSRYSPLNEQDAKSPVLLTMLRKDAIQYVLEEHNGYSVEESEKFADRAFEAWAKARHDAIPFHFADSVLPCLEQIRSLSTSSGHPVLVGAITDGNSDPRNVEVLSDMFDFCINAEGVGVAKPDKRVYTAAMTYVATHPSMHELFGPFQDNLTEDLVETMVGPWWVHVGDDFTKDVVAAKSLKMRSIWSRELILQPKRPAEIEEKTPTQKKTVEELVKSMAEMKVVEMEIGAEDFLADSIRQEFADAVIDRFEELSQVLSDWHQQALQSKHSLPTAISAPSIAPADAAVAMTPAVATAEISSIPQTNPTEAKKFCVYCGTKLPQTAKFCFSCGEKQPELK